MLQREDARFNRGEGALFAKFVGACNHLGNQHHITRRARDQDEFAIGGGFQRESRIFHAQLHHHLQDLVGLHVAQINQGRPHFAHGVNVKRRTIVVPRQIIHRRNAIQEFRRRHILKVTREHPRHTVGEQNRNPLRHAKTFQCRTNRHLACHQGVGLALPRQFFANGFCRCKGRSAKTARHHRCSPT